MADKNSDHKASQSQADLLADILGTSAQTNNNSDKSVEKSSLSGDEVDLLADILGETTSTAKVKATAPATSESIFSTVQFELVMPNWNMGRLTRLFHSSFRVVEEACSKADQWVDHTQALLERLINDLPEKWPERDSSDVTARLLGQFYAISQQYPVSQYLDNFTEVVKLPNTFPPSMDVSIPEEMLKIQEKTVPWWAKGWTIFRKSRKQIQKISKGDWKPSANIKMRNIGAYWLKYQHTKQLRGTIRDAGDLYFVFLKSVQRLFNLAPGESMDIVKEDMGNDVKQLADNLRSTHRSHLMHIYKGFERDLRNSLSPWKTFSLIPTSQITKQIQQLETEHNTHLEQYSRALEYALEDFHIRLQIFQIQREALRTFQGEIGLVRHQQKRIQKQIAMAIQRIQSVVPESVESWHELNKYKYSFKMNQVQKGFFSAIARLQSTFQQVLNNNRTNNLADIVLSRYGQMAQTFAEHSNIVHLDKLWSWTHKKIEIDESVPLRYTVEQYFITELHDALNFFHKRWLNYVRVWADQIDQQEQFFHFSFYSLRQEHASPITDWQESDREAVYHAVKESSQPTIHQLETISRDLEKEMDIFVDRSQKLIDDTVVGLESAIFDPSIRQKISRMVSEGTGTMGAVARFFIDVKIKEFLYRIPGIKQCIDIYRWGKKRVKKLVSYFQRDVPPAEIKTPAYYSRVFVVEPLEVETLFVERQKELDELHHAWEMRETGSRAVVAIVGMPGIGKRSLIHHFFSTHASKSTLRVQLNLKDEGIIAIVNNNPFTLDRMLHKVEVDRFEVVLLEGLDSCFVETVEGAKHLKRFFAWLQKTTNKIFWVLPINLLAWQTIELLSEVGGTFTHVIHLASLSKAALQDILYKRHNVVGLPVQYKLPETTFYYWFNRFRPEDCRRFLEWKFFNEMENRCMGNPAIAIHLWIEQTRMLAESETIIVNPFIDEPALPVLDEDELLILRIILAQGPIGPHHLQYAVVSSKYLRICLDKLKNLDLIVIRKHGQITLFSVNLNSYRTIYRLLQKAMLLS